MVDHVYVIRGKSQAFPGTLTQDLHNGKPFLLSILSARYCKTFVCIAKKKKYTDAN